MFPVFNKRKWEENISSNAGIFRAFCTIESAAGGCQAIQTTIILVFNTHKIEKKK
jgi:hypothetical protein